MADNTSETIVQCVEVQEPLTEFTLFPELPLELRLKIFKHTLSTGPKGIRVLRVAIDTVTSVTNSKIAIKRKFEAQRSESKVECTSHLIFRLLSHPHSIHIKDIGLLSASPESRGVYLGHFTQSLRATENGLIRFAKEDIIYIANIWDCVQTASFRNMLKAGKGFEGIPCQKLAFSVLWLYDEFLHGVLSTDPRACGEDWGLSFIMKCQGLRETGAIHQGEIDIRRQEPKLDRADTIRRQWEECEELRVRKLPEVCVWDKDWERIKRAKKEA